MVLILVKNLKFSFVILAMSMSFLSCQRKDFDPVKVNEKAKKSQLVQIEDPSVHGSSKKMSDQKFSQDQKNLIDFAFQGCDDELRSCKNIVALKENPNAAYEISLAATKETTAKSMDRFIRLALEVKTNSNDQRVDVLIFGMILERYNEFIKISQERYEKLTQIFLSNENLVKSPEIRTKILASNPLNSEGSGKSRSIRIAMIKSYLMIVDDKVSFQSELEIFFQKNELSSFAEKINQHNPTLIGLVRAKSLSKSLVEFLVINYLKGQFNSHEIMDTLAIYKERKFETALSMEEQIVNLLKLQTLFVSDAANRNFAAYTNILKKTTDIYEFLEIMTAISTKNRALWAGYLSALDFGHSLSKILVEDNSQHEMKELVQSGKRTIQFISSWPHLAAVVYFISKNKIDLEWITPWGTQKITYRKVISEFVGGQLKDLLNYLNQDGTLSTEDVVSSLYYAFSSGFFEDIGVDSFDFLNETMLRILSDDIRRFENDKDQIEQVMNLSGYFQNLMRRADVVEKKAGLSFQVQFEDFQNDPIFGDSLARFATVLVPCSDSPKCKIDNDIKGFNLLVKNVESTVEQVKNYLTERIRIVRSIKIALEQAQVRRGKTMQETAEKFKTATPLLNQFDTSLKGYISKMRDYQNLYFNAAIKVYDLSRKVKHDVFMTELEHLKKVHGLMTQARNGQTTPSQMKGYLDSVNHNIYLKAYSTYEKISTTSYTSHVLDHILRMINKTTDYIGGDSSKQSVATMDDTYLKKLQLGILGDGRARHITIEIPYHPDLETFLRDGMVKLHSYQNYESPNTGSSDPQAIRSAYASSWFDDKPTLNRIIENFSDMQSHFFNALGNLYLLYNLFDVKESSDELVEMIIRSYNFLNVRPEEADFYKYTGRKGFYEPYLRDYKGDPHTSATFDQRIDQPRGVLDAVYLTVAQPSGTMSRDSEAGKPTVEVAFDWGIADYKANIKRFYLNRKRRGKLFFDVDPQMDALIEKAGLEVLERNHKAVRELEASILKYSQVKYFYHVDKEQKFETPMLDKRLMEQYQTHIDDFNRETDGKYKSYTP